MTLLFGFFGHFVRKIDLFSLASFFGPRRSRMDGTPPGEIVTKRLRKQLTTPWSGIVPAGAPAPEAKRLRRRFDLSDLNRYATEALFPPRLAS
jgi:hypothetical protein